MIALLHQLEKFLRHIMQKWLSISIYCSRLVLLSLCCLETDKSGLALAQAMWAYLGQPALAQALRR